MPLNNPSTYTSPAARELAELDKAVVPDLPPHVARGLDRIADFHKDKRQSGGYTQAAMGGVRPGDHYSDQQKDHAGEVANQAAAEIVKGTANLDDDQFVEVLTAYQQQLKDLTGLKPKQVPLESPTLAQAGLGALASFLIQGSPQAQMNAVAAPFQYQIQRQAVEQQKANQEFEVEFNTAVQQAKSAGDVLDILAKRQDVKLQQDRLDAREQMRIQGRQTLAQMNNATKVQVAEIARSDNDPVWKRDRMVEMGLSQDEANALVTAGDRAKMVGAQFKQRELELFNETFEDQALAATLKNDLLNEQILKTEDERSLLQERVKYYGQEVATRLGILRATLANREMQTLIGALGLTMDYAQFQQRMSETPELKAQQELIKGMTSKLAELDANRRAASGVWERLRDPNTFEATTEEAKAAKQAYIEAEAAYKAVAKVLENQKRALQELQGQTAPAGGDQAVQDAINNALSGAIGK